MAHAKLWRQYLRDARALDLTRERLYRGLVWAICHVHNQVSTGESEYVRWVDHGILPSTLPRVRHRAIRDAHTYSQVVDLHTFARWSTERKIDDIVRHVHGLSYAKATFALTCLGVIDVACIDVHLGRKYGVKTSWSNARRYLDTVKAIYGRVHGSGRKQWNDYWHTVRAFRRTSHAPFFRSIGVTTFDKQLTLEV